MPSARTVFTLLLLYASKSGAVIVGLFVLPWYQRILGPEAFGVVAVIFSLQAFLLMLDFGMSTLVGRDVAANQNARIHLVTWRAAGLLLHVAYAGLLIIAVFVDTLFASPLPTQQVVLCIVFFWALTVQNVGQSALLAKRQYAAAASIQVIGVLGRALITLAALTHISADLATFLAAQALTAVAQMMATGWFCRHAMDPTYLRVDLKTLRVSMGELARRGRPLVLFGLAGAAVLQLDKVIIPLFVSVEALGPYFLASALCLTPISVLAGPITQYFQPRIIANIAEGNAAQAQDNLRKLTLSICAAVAIPSALLWLGREPIINMWLQHQPIAVDVVRYVEVLLPGVTLGALGFVPYTILVAHQDFRALAILSASMTVVTLLATAASASMGSVLAVCWVYAGYHSLSAMVSWLRAMRLQPPPPHHYATRSARHALVVLASITTITVVLTFFSSF